MTSDQHDLRKSRSCLKNVLETLKNWTKAMDRGYGLDIIYLDYQKAFDTVPHKIVKKTKVVWIRWESVALD